VTLIEETDPRATWLRSLGWRQAADGQWAGQVIATKGRYRPMPLERAFEVALKRSVTDKQFVVEIEAGQVRLALPWRAVLTSEEQAPLRLESRTAARARVRDERPDALRGRESA
jgi:hypothetical protein